jgi:acetyl-CoA C-acetyltransferase
VAELHDAFTVLEIAESEEVGFFHRGEGARALEEGRTQIGGDTPISPSGGLKARGHSPGATGIAQVVELVWQLRGDAGPRQVKGAEIGFSVNLGGLANNAVAFVLQVA